MKVNACDFCLGAVPEDPTVAPTKPDPQFVVAPWSIGWKGLPRLHACAAHRDRARNRPEGLSCQLFIAKVQERAMCGYNVMFPHTKARPSEKAMAAATLREPLVRVAGKERAS